MIALTNSLTKRWFDLKYHPDIAAAYACNDRFQFYRCGRRAYKSELMKRKGVMKAPIPGNHGARLQLYTAPTQKQAKKIFWEDLISLSPKEWVRKINRTELVIDYIFGSSIEVAGLDQPQRIEGRGYDDVYCDESADIKPSAIAISIMPALADRQGSLTRGGVPKRTGKGARDYNRAFDHVRRHGVIPGTNFKASAFSWKSDTVLSDDELLVQKSLLDEKDYREQFEASVETIGGGIFHAWGADNIQACSYDSARPIIVGMDFNVSPMCWIMGHDIDGKLYIFDELWKLDTYTQECLDLLHSKYPKHQSGWLFYGDATGRGRRSEAPVTNYYQVANDSRFTNSRIKFPSSNPLIEDRFSSTNMMMRNANGFVRLFVDPSCEKLIEDVEVYSRKENSMDPDSQDNTVGHMSDALGYVIHSRYPVRLNRSKGKAGVTLSR